MPEYYRLPKEQQWLGSLDTAYTIGGRDTDIHQISLSLEVSIKEHYAINEVPPEIVRKIAMLKGLLETGEERIQELIMLVATGEED